MYVLIAMNAFKGSLTARAANQAVKNALLDVRPEAMVHEIIPADGGDGTLDAVQHLFGGTMILDPKREKARFLWLPDRLTAVLCTADADGLGTRSPEENNPHERSTFALGEQVKAALSLGAETFWIGLGGSASVDGGIGFLQALGGRFTKGNTVLNIRDPLSIMEADGFSPSPVLRRLQSCRLVGLCDVDGPLTGPRGTRLYMPQKGVKPQEIPAFEAALAHLYQLLPIAPKYRIPRHLAAAGGLGAALRLLYGELISGAAFVASHSRLPEWVGKADLLISGEGQIDAQSFEGKWVGMMAQEAREKEKPLLLFCGRRAPEHLEAFQALTIEAMVDQVTEHEARRRPSHHLFRLARSFFQQTYL